MTVRYSVVLVLCLNVGWIHTSSLLAQDGAALYRTHCSVCHEASDGSRAPGRAVLRQLSPEQILSALEKGAMTRQGSERSRAERRALAEFLAEKTLGNDLQTLIPKSAFCESSGKNFQRSLSGPGWSGWGVTLENTRFQPGKAAGIQAKDLSRLKLKWAFGFPGASSASAQPVVAGGRVYVGSWEGEVYSLDAGTGCIHWMLETEAGVRSAVTIGKGGSGTPNVYFGDLAGKVYAVDAATGKLRWKVAADDYPYARITGSPTLYRDRLYVPVSSREESQVGDPQYPCCRFRGSVVALDARTGEQVWKTYTISAAAVPTHKNKAGTQISGPSGAPVWNSPTIDVKRNVLYVGSGNNYSSPSTNMSDSVIAFDLSSGKIRWFRQLTPGDIWNGSCSGNGDPATCPDKSAPDSDFAASPILVAPRGGRQMIIAGQKSGMVYALNPDRNGEILWQQRVSKGGTLGGVQWGPATDRTKLYVAVSDAIRIGGQFDPNTGGGIVALDLRTGQKLWNAAPPSCEGRKPCSPVQSAAVTAIPGVIFSGSVDGHMRAYSTEDGKLLWDYDTLQEYETVNTVKAKGGSIDNGGPAVVGGMLFTNSGYSHHTGVSPGNVFLAFSVN